MELEQFLSKQFDGSQNLDSILQYHFSTGGKRLRAQLVLTEANRMKLDLTKAKVWAAVCEILHNATLIHDDIQDNDPMRRGQPSLWKKYGVAQAINAGDLLIFKAFAIASTLNCPELIIKLSEISEKLVQGQSMELSNMSDLKGFLWENYIKMSELKTGALFLLPTEGVRILTQTPENPDHQQAWLRLGTCYQILDDLKDFYGLKQEGQKQKDLLEKRLNALTSFLFDNFSLDTLFIDYTSADPELSGNVTDICFQIEKNNVVQQLVEWVKRELEQIHFLQQCETAQFLFEHMTLNLQTMETFYEKQ